MKKKNHGLAETSGGWSFRARFWGGRNVAGHRIESRGRILQGLGCQVRVALHHRAGLPAAEPL